MDVTEIRATIDGLSLLKLLVFGWVLWRVLDAALDSAIAFVAARTAAHDTEETDGA